MAMVHWIPKTSMTGILTRELTKNRESWLFTKDDRRNMTMILKLLNYKMQVIKDDTSTYVISVTNPRRTVIIRF